MDTGGTAMRSPPRSRSRSLGDDLCSRPRRYPSVPAFTFQHIIPGLDEAGASRFDLLVSGDGGASDEPHQSYWLVMVEGTAEACARASHLDG